MSTAAPRTTPIRARLLRLALAASLPLVLFAAFLVFEITAEHHAKEAQELSDRAAILAAAVEQALYGATRELSVLAVDKELLEADLAAAYQEAQAFAAQSSIGGSISLLTPDGRVLFDTRHPLGTRLPNAGDVAGLAEVARTQRSRISDLLASTIDHRPEITVDVPVTHGDRLVHVLRLLIQPARILDILRAQHLHGRWIAVVADRQGAVVARTGNAPGELGRPAPEGLRRAAAAADGGTFTSDDGPAIAGVFRRLPQSDWVVALAEPKAELTAQRSRFLLMLGGSAALMVALAAALAIGMATRLERCLQEVSAMARRLGAGETVEPVATGIRELDAAADSLSRAATLIASREAELSHAGKVAHDALTARAKFFAAANHDLRQPVQSLFLFHATLAGMLPPGHEGHRPLSFADRSLQALQRLLDGLRDVSRLDAGAVVPVMVPVPLGGFLDALSEEYRLRAADQGITLRAVSSRLWVRSDPALLDRVVRNLLENALRYTPRGGRVLLGCRRRGGHVRLVVADTGIGIPANQLGIIFEEFHQLGNSARNSALGLGLGLAIVRRSCDLLGHGISVDSAVGKGSIFTLHMPMTARGLPAP